MARLNYAGKSNATFSVDGAGTPADGAGARDSPGNVPADAIVVSDAHLLFNADFNRSGVDLILSKDDRELVLHDYFEGEKRAALLSPDGTHLTGNIVNALIGHVEHAQTGGAPEAAKIIGHVQTAIGSGTLTRACGIVVEAKVGDPVCQGDVIETAADGRIGLRFVDGTAFNLSPGARMVLDEFVCDSNGTSHSALFGVTHGSFDFIVGQVAKTGCLRIDTPVGSIRGRARTGGIGTLTLTALIFCILKEVQAAEFSSQRPLLDSLDDDKINPKDLQLNGVVELFMRDGRHYTLDDPSQTVVIRGSGSISAVTNSPERMEELQRFQQEALAAYALGTTTGPTSTGGGGSPQPFSTPGELQPINFQIDQPGPQNSRSPTTQLVFSSSASIDQPLVLLKPLPPPVLTLTVITPMVGDSTVNTANTLNASGASTGFAINGTTSGVENGRTVTVTIVNGSNVAVEAFTATVTNNAWSVNVSPTQAHALSDGGYTVMASVSNAAGTPAPPASQNLTVDETPPVVTFDTVSFADTGVQGDHITDNHQVTLSGTVSDNVTVSQVQVFNGSQLLGTATVDNVRHTWTLTTTLASGTYNHFNATAIDEVGNPANATTTQTVQVNNPPVITVGAGNSATGAVTEDVAEDPAHNLTSTGTLAFSDVDFSDTHSVTGVVASVGALGTLTASVTTDDSHTTGIGGVITWHYSVADDAVVHLAQGQTKVETFTISLFDGASTVTKDVVITITGTNDAPTLAAVVAGALTDTSALDTFGNLTGQLVGNDADSGETATLTYAALDATNHPVTTAVAGLYGSLTVNADGTYSYVANATAINALHVGAYADTFTVQTTDVHGATGTATLTVNITGANDTPVVTAVAASATDTAARDAGTVVASGNAITSDSDRDSATTLTVTDIKGTCDASALTVIAAGTIAHGTYGDLTIHANGSYSYVANGAFDALHAGNNPTDVFTFTVSDGDGGNVPTTLTFNITGANDTPVVTAVAASATDTAARDAGTVVASGNAITSDSDRDSATTLTVSDIKGAGDASALTVIAAGTTAHGTYGDLTIHADGSYSYVANGAFDALHAGNNPTDVFTFTVSDGDGGNVPTTLTFNITGANDTPVVTAVAASATDTAARDAGTVVASGNAITSDSDRDSATTLTVSDIKGAGDASALTVIAAGTIAHGTYGDLTIHADGSYSYVANNAFDALHAGNNPTDVFTFTVSDGHGGNVPTTLTFNITGADDTPVVAAVSKAVADTSGVDAGHVVASGTAGTGGTGVLAGDSDRDSGDSLTVTAVNGSSGNVGGNVAGTYGTLHLNADGSYTYTANAALDALPSGSNPTDVFTFTVSDGHGGNVPTTLTFNITGADDTPVVAAVSKAVADTSGVDAGTVVASGTAGTGGTGVLAGDSDRDSGDSLTVTAVNGSSGNVGGNVAGTYGTLHLNADGSYTYTANAALDALPSGSNPTDVFTFTVSDGHGGNVPTTLTFNITGADDTPVVAAVSKAVADTSGVDAGTVVASGTAGTGGTGVLAGDSDRDSGDSLTVTAVNGSSGNVGGNVAGTYGTLHLNADGSYTYTANAALDALPSGSNPTDVFTFTVSDGHGGNVPTTLTFNITGADDAPVIGADTVQAVPSGWSFDSANGHYYRYVAASQITWNAANTAAIAAGGYLATITDANENTFVHNLVGSHDAWLGGSDATQEGTWAWVTGPESGTVFYINSPQSFPGYSNWNTGEPNNLDHGIFSPHDENYLQILGTGKWNDEQGPDVPSANETDGYVEEMGKPGVVLANFVEDTPTAIATAALLANDTDVDGGPLVVSAVNATSAHGGTLTLAGGVITYTPSANFNGADQFSYTVSDGRGGTATGTLTFSVTAVDDAPVIANTGNTVTFTEETAAVAVDSALTVTDIDNTTLASAKVAISSGFQTGDVLAATVSGTLITANYNSSTHVLTLSGVDTLAHYQQVLDSVSFKNTTDSDKFNDRTISWVVNDGTTDSATKTTTVKVVEEQHERDPAGIAGEPINIGLAGTANDGTVVTMTIADVPSGWTVNGGMLLNDGIWTVQTSDPASLTITSPSDFTGAMLFNVIETWKQADGSTATVTVGDNVEAYSVGSPIFALSGDDFLTASSGKDLLVFSQPIGHDTVYSFAASQDQIDLIGYAEFHEFC